MTTTVEDDTTTDCYYSIYLNSIIETEAPTTEHEEEEMTTTVEDETTTDYQPLITTYNF